MTAAEAACSIRRAQPSTSRRPRSTAAARSGERARRVTPQTGAAARRPARGASSTCSSGSPCSTRGATASASRRDLRARPPRRSPRCCAASSRPTGRSPITASKSQYVSPRLAASLELLRAGPAPASLVRHQVQALRRSRAATRPSPPARRPGRSPRVSGPADALASASAAASRVLFEREIGFHPGQSQGGRPRAAQCAKSACTATR